jgi:hypothetical protein
VGMFASWTHGNALVVEGDALEYFEAMEPTKIETQGVLDDHVRYTFGETEVHEVRPRLTVNHLGWGTVVKMPPRMVQWFHIPLPTPVIHDDHRLEMIRFFLLWQIEGEAKIDMVHLYDGKRLCTKVFKGVLQGPDGNISLGPGPRDHGPSDHTLIGFDSTFNLWEPEVCWSGFGVSFRVSCSGVTVLTVTAAGADYQPTKR